jgi:hypothetical protein
VKLGAVISPKSPQKRNCPTIAVVLYTLLQEAHMPKFLIEREIPGAGSMSPEQFQGVAEKSCSVLRDLGPKIQWLHSYVTDDKIYCVYIAPDEKTIREHATRGGFPANRVAEIKNVIDPTTAEPVDSH